MNKSGELPEVVPPNDGQGLLWWMQRVYAAVKTLSERVGELEGKVKEMEDRTNG